MQAVMDELPARDDASIGHAAQVVAAANVEYVPGGHAAQDVAASTAPGQFGVHETLQAAVNPSLEILPSLVSRTRIYPVLEVKSPDIVVLDRASCSLQFDVVVHRSMATKS